MSRDNQSTEHQRKREEADDGVESSAVQDKIPVDALRIAVKRVEILNVGRDEHDEGDDNEDIDGREGVRKERMPSAARMGRPNNALRKDDVDDV